MFAFFMLILPPRFTPSERPELPPRCPLRFRKMIEDCWHDNSRLRLNLSEVCDRFQEYGYEEEGWM